MTDSYDVAMLSVDSSVVVVVRGQVVVVIVSEITVVTTIAVVCCDSETGYGGVTEASVVAESRLAATPRKW